MGVAVLDGDGRVTRLVEKPKQFISPYAVIGIYMFDSPCLRKPSNAIRPSARGELEITETIQYLIESRLQSRRAAADRLVDRYGQDLDILEANRLILDILERKIAGEVRGDSHLEGRVVLEPGALVTTAPSAGQPSSARGPALKTPTSGRTRRFSMIASCRTARSSTAWCWKTRASWMFRPALPTA